MPWPPKQRTAIFLDVQRRKGTAAAEALMHEAGYGGKKTVDKTEAAFPDVKTKKKRKRGKRYPGLSKVLTKQ